MDLNDLKTPEDLALEWGLTARRVQIHTRKAGRKAKEKVGETVVAVKETAKKAAGIPNIIIQSPMGGIITAEGISAKVPKGTKDIYIRVDENKLYYVLKNGETGDVDIWE